MSDVKIERKYNGKSAFIPAMELTCKQCGKLFIVAKQTTCKRKYCSIQCSAKASMRAKDGMRRCPKCGETKPYTGEYFSSSRGQLKSWCKKCCSSAAMDRYRKDPTAHYKRIRGYILNKRKWDETIRIHFDFSDFVIPLPDHVKICSRCGCQANKYHDFSYGSNQARLSFSGVCNDCHKDKISEWKNRPGVKDHINKCVRERRKIAPDRFREWEKRKYTKRKESGKLALYNKKKIMDGSAARWARTAYERLKSSGKYSELLEKTKKWKKKCREDLGYNYVADKLRRCGASSVDDELLSIKRDQISITRELRKLKREANHGTSGS